MITNNISQAQVRLVSRFRNEKPSKLCETLVTYDD